MPFKSRAQRAYLFIHHPEVAQEFASKTPRHASLPYKVGRSDSNDELRKALKLRLRRKMTT
jgi:hypothetical protein